MRARLAYLQQFVTKRRTLRQDTNLALAFLSDLRFVTLINLHFVHGMMQAGNPKSAQATPKSAHKPNSLAPKSPASAMRTLRVQADPPTADVNASSLSRTPSKPIEVLADPVEEAPAPVEEASALVEEAPAPVEEAPATPALKAVCDP